MHYKIGLPLTDLFFIIYENSIEIDLLKIFGLSLFKMNKNWIFYLS